MRGHRYDLRSDILEIIHTRDEAKEFLKSLDELLQELYKQSVDIEAILNNSFSHEKKEKILKLLPKYSIDVASSQQLQKFFAELKVTMQQIPVVTLTIAFDPKTSFIKILSSWITMHLKIQAFIDVSVNTQVVGGAIITYKGKYKDYTLKKVLHDKLASGQLHIANILHE